MGISARRYVGQYVSGFGVGFAYQIWTWNVEVNPKPSSTILVKFAHRNFSRVSLRSAWAILVMSSNVLLRCYIPAILLKYNHPPTTSRPPPAPPAPSSDAPSAPTAKTPPRPPDPFPPARQPPGPQTYSHRAPSAPPAPAQPA